MRIVNRVMKPSALFSFHCLTSNQVTYINHVTELANLSGSLYTFKQAFCFFIENIQTVPCTHQTEVASYNTYIRLHNLIDFFHTLCNQNSFFVADSAFCIPFRNIFVEIVTVEYTKCVFSGRIRINNGFYQ